jgi:hypothetical protein
VSLARSSKSVKAARRPSANVVHLHRWPLNTPYPKVVADVAAMAAAPGVTGIADAGVADRVEQSFQPPVLQASCCNL